jgi:hypothetical protein
MKRVVPCLLVALLAVVGCGEKEPEPPPEPPPPPPPTAQELRSQEMQDLRPIMQPGAQMSEEEIIGRVNNTKAKLRGEVNGEKALSLITRDIREQLNASFDQEMWESVVRGSIALGTLEPDDPRLERYRETAMLEIQRPKLTVKGFYIDPETQTTTVFLDVFLPETGETVQKQVQEGEEFNDIQLLDIIGRQKGIRYRYLPTNKVYETMK